MFESHVKAVRTFLLELLHNAKYKLESVGTGIFFLVSFHSFIVVFLFVCFVLFCFFFFFLGFFWFFFFFFFWGGGVVGGRGIRPSCIVYINI